MFDKVYLHQNEREKQLERTEKEIDGKNFHVESWSFTNETKYFAFIFLQSGKQIQLNSIEMPVSITKLKCGHIKIDRHFIIVICIF